MHKALVYMAAKWLKKHEKNVLVPNCHTVAYELKSVSKTGEIPDVMGWCSWTSILIEVKASRNDFLKDKNKPFRKVPKMGMGEFRYYLCPEGIIKEEELPLKWGLLNFKEGSISIIKKAEKQEANHKAEVGLILSYKNSKLW